MARLDGGIVGVNHILPGVVTQSWRVQVVQQPLIYDDRSSAHQDEPQDTERAHHSHHFRSTDSVSRHRGERSSFQRRMLPPANRSMAVPVKQHSQYLALNPVTNEIGRCNGT